MRSTFSLSLCINNIWWKLQSLLTPQLLISLGSDPVLCSLLWPYTGLAFGFSSSSSTIFSRGGTDMSTFYRTVVGNMLLCETSYAFLPSLGIISFSLLLTTAVASLFVVFFCGGADRVDDAEDKSSEKFTAEFFQVWVHRWLKQHG